MLVTTRSAPASRKASTLGGRLAYREDADAGRPRTRDVRQRVAHQDSSTRRTADRLDGPQDRGGVGFHESGFGVGASDHRRHVPDQAVRPEVGVHRAGRVVADHRDRKPGSSGSHDDFPPVLGRRGRRHGAALRRAERIFNQARNRLLAGRSGPAQHFQRIGFALQLRRPVHAAPAQQLHQLARHITRRVPGKDPANRPVKVKENCTPWKGGHPWCARRHGLQASP